MSPQSVNTEMKQPRSIKILRWITYISSSILFALWGSIFIQRISTMFQTLTLSDIPPLIWVVQGLHLLLLVGYLSVFKRKLLGCILIAISGIPFFALVGGENTMVYTLFSLIPAALSGFLWWVERKMKLINQPR